MSQCVCFQFVTVLNQLYIINNCRLKACLVDFSILWAISLVFFWQIDLSEPFSVVGVSLTWDHTTAPLSDGITVLLCTGSVGTYWENNNKENLEGYNSACFNLGSTGEADPDGWQVEEATELW